jgi:hypothetical protein
MQRCGDAEMWRWRDKIMKAGGCGGRGIARGENWDCGAIWKVIQGSVDRVLPPRLQRKWGVVILKRLTNPLEDMRRYTGGRGVVIVAHLV